MNPTQGITRAGGGSSGDYADPSDRSVARPEKGARAHRKAEGDGVAECLHCRRQFEPRKAGHVFCSRECRHRGVRKEDDDSYPPSEEELERLFDPGRDPDARVEPDDWHPIGWDPEWVELDLCQTVATRRYWYRSLLRDGML